MAVVPQESIEQFEALMEEVDEPLRKTFQILHQGYPHETLMRFLKAREGNVTKAHKMLIDCLNWRVQNDIDDMLALPFLLGWGIAKPLENLETHCSCRILQSVRDSQLIGLSGYSFEGLPVFAIGAGMSTYDNASPAATKKHGKHVSKCIKVLDMTGLKLSALNQIKVVKPLLQERTRSKVDVLSGSGQDDLLKIMDYSSLPHFCRKRSSGSSKYLDGRFENIYSLDHPFHQQLYNYTKQQFLVRQPVEPLKQGSVHVTLPEDADEEVIAKTLESELEKFKDLERCPESLKNLRINDGKS
ncbi:hypothetical protein DH2020_033185 [Rehmannia glutinosa]|uniref:CRAL/TRIO N-terminal domain-containing protein n=1 Tax=Rehmannia glutinosa TaxID=99300 RepID=A0ABR0VDH2_REHGL